MSKLVDFPTSLPAIPIPENTNAAEVVASFVSRLEHLKKSDFKDDAVWRDTFALAGTSRTFYGPSPITAAWHETTKRSKAGLFSLNEKTARIIRSPLGPHWIQGKFSFETSADPPTTCSGIITLVLTSASEWRIWTLRSILEQLKGESNVDVLARVNGTEQATNGHSEERHFDCIVIGGGPSGLSQGGRLKALGISYVVLDTHPKVGDNWKLRYDSTRLHTSREYSHLPFERTFGPEYQEWLTKDDLAEGYQRWVAKYDINIWTGTTVVSGSWDSSNKKWTLRTKRDGKDEQSITGSFIVVAGGAGGQVPKMPEYPNREKFRGLVLHSAEYRNAFQWKGKRGVVVGTANTGHDVADDMLQAGLSSVTMIQRGNTYILPAEYYKKTADLYYNATVPTEAGDRESLTQPMAIVDLLSQINLHHLTNMERPRFDALEGAGFKLDRYGSIIDHLYNRMGGHYIDVGTSAKISKGLIKIQTSTPVSYTETGILFDDGTELEADVVVFATGFEGNMRYLVRDVFGEEIAEQMGDFWGLDKEGELNGVWKGTGHPAMWYHGGTIGQQRFYSRFIALQIKAKMLGTPLVVYDKTP
ncbi:putative flavin-containing monooxygenase [Hyaloscypha variabilis F]|uniref:Putative flavin-containing monooxygenase n=1 Tax=Hyaloscypha variabilis (strain UAMH 11265 / GT02V1 / F) TaxID=1149755 RepID=A0A2J6RHQ8_HYAVF|nr:putative flavin-containing monooxygenase [Hyaloscypha variabilis F]